MGINESEARLGALSRSTFLSMWSYQNPFYVPAKELCDVLVVFGNDVIVMSDKLIEFGDHTNPLVNWKRWYKRAVAGSVRQLRGAERRLLKSPANIYCDSSASSPFPLRLPSPEEMRIYLVAVANGSEDECIKSFGNPGLQIDSCCHDDSKYLTTGTHLNTGTFVHVLSETALEAIFDSLDTTRDFIDYLVRKELALSQGGWLIQGEQNLIGGYMLSQPGDRPFSIPTSSFPEKDGVRVVEHGIWPAYLSSNQKQEREKIRKPSYVIDNLIEHVAEQYEQNKLGVSQDKGLEYHEQAFRLLASESRLSRQLISSALFDILGESTETFWANVTESPECEGLYYLWLTYPEPPEEWDFEQQDRVLLLELSRYMLVARATFPDAKRIFGICLPNRECKQTGYFFRVIDGEPWTPEMQQYAEDLRSKGYLSNIETLQYASSR